MITINEVCIENTSLSGQDLRNYRFNACYFENVDFKDCKISEETFKECMFMICKDLIMPVGNNNMCGVKGRIGIE